MSLTDSYFTNNGTYQETYKILKNIVQKKLDNKQKLNYFELCFLFLENLYIDYFQSIGKASQTGANIRNNSFEFFYSLPESSAIEFFNLVNRDKELFYTYFKYGHLDFDENKSSDPNFVKYVLKEIFNLGEIYVSQNENLETRVKQQREKMKNMLITKSQSNSIKSWFEETISDILKYYVEKFVSNRRKENIILSYVVDIDEFPIPANFLGQEGWLKSILTDEINYYKFLFLETIEQEKINLNKYLKKFINFIVIENDIAIDQRSKPTEQIKKQKNPIYELVSLMKTNLSKFSTQPQVVLERMFTINEMAHTKIILDIQNKKLPSFFEFKSIFENKNDKKKQEIDDDDSEATVKMSPSQGGEDSMTDSEDDDSTISMNRNNDNKDDKMRKNNTGSESDDEEESTTERKRKIDDTTGKLSERNKLRKIKCQLCNEDNIQYLKMCGKCKSVVYCSQEHQIIDWSKHKIHCK